MAFHLLVELLDVGREQFALFIGRGFHALQGPAVAVDGHRAAQAVEGAAAHRVERNHVERVAVADGVDRLQGEEIVRLAALADGVHIVGAGDADGFVVEADALHTVDQIDESGVFHACHLGAEHVLQLAVGTLEEHFRGGLHHHQVALFQDAVKHLQAASLGVFGEGVAQFGAVDGEDHLVIDLVAVRP